MTIIEAINQVDELRRNAISQKQKIIWLSRCEAAVKNRVVDKYEGAEEISFSGFDSSTDLKTELIMPEPFDEAYIHYLSAQIYFSQQELESYNSEISMYEVFLNGFKSWWSETHMPVGERRFRF